MSERDAPLTTGEAAAWIRDHLEFGPVPEAPEISLYRAHPSSGLWRVAGGGAAPYWAYEWAGGLALARYLLDHPETVRGRRVLDMGAGGGVVSIAAARAGAGAVTAAEIDPVAAEALRLNAAANGARIEVVLEDLTGGPAPDVDLVTVGDLFYEIRVAGPLCGFLDRCARRGATVLIGDPGRKFLPRAHLTPLADYEVSDVARLSERSVVYRYAPGS